MRETVGEAAREKILTAVVYNSLVAAFVVEKDACRLVKGFSAECSGWYAQD
jgi:hypothetical protein